MRPPPWQHCLLLLKNPFLEKNTVNIFVSLYHIALQCSAISILFILVNVHILMVSLYSCILYPCIRKCSISLSSECCIFCILVHIIIVPLHPCILIFLYPCILLCSCIFVSLYPDVFCILFCVYVAQYPFILVSYRRRSVFGSTCKLVYRRTGRCVHSE